MEAALISSAGAPLLRCGPPPPPPPPPPPLQRLLPPPPSCRQRSMKKLNWDTIPSQHVLGKLNVWTSELPPRELVLDTRSMEELFSQVERRACAKAAASHAHPPQPQMSILDSKKSMNVGIFLRYFKRPAAELVMDIVRGNWRAFDGGKLTELCKLLPDESEVKSLLSFNGNVSLLPEADWFMAQLVKVPGYEDLLKTLVLRQEFPLLMEETNKSLAVMIKAANELLDCDDLHAVIRLVLKAGNYMNAGGYSADAMGFRMASLLKLADTKANKPGVNLMHYVAKQAEDSDGELLTFPSQLEHIGMAARICKEEVLADLERQVEKLEEVKLYVGRHPDFQQEMSPFLMQCEEQLLSLKVSARELDVLSYAVAEYFCEDPNRFKLEECCAIFHSFCRRFRTAVQENRERDAAEQRRERKESIRPSTKRKSDLKLPMSSESSLESALRSFLSEGAPAGRSRKTARTPAPGVQSPEKKAIKEEIFPRTPSPPRTPPSMSRDVFFARNGDADSPWTILSPLACSRQRRDGPEADESIRERGPRGRSASVDSARWSPPPLATFRLRTLFRKGAGRRTYSSGSGDPGAPFALISFFKRFGGKREAAEERNCTTNVT
ncbi:FH2 domain-containing protein 1-like [Corythoichthys intestinalis]|uniref:FH2 domain-containing protein 1-like n=1 Tax=Corythoichthys intestinalis TaxID=161448 RepID=UPI0025A61F63|nr:FH2 domain-containing protein 1-like [Corythoichthys intestinalis]XP_057677675.1 FH2 domain-containing protein 1-like [Corythoichthys intestinalis]